MKNISILVVLGIILLTFTASVSAHRPIWGEELGTTEIPDLSTSFAVYRDLQGGDDQDIFTFEGRQGQNLYAGINIPAISGLERYGVSFALFGPGLPEVNESRLPPEHPEELGAKVFLSEISEDFYEPFTQTNYWGRQRIDLELPEDGTYYLIVWNPDGQAGKYVLDTGRAEVFSPADLLRFPVWWVRVHLFFGHGPYLYAGGLALLAIFGSVFFISKKHRQNDPTPA